MRASNTFNLRTPLGARGQCVQTRRVHDTDVASGLDWGDLPLAIVL